MKHKSLFNSIEEQGVHVHYDDHSSQEKISESIMDLLPPDQSKPVVFTCIGTDRSTGDSLGPLIGSFLQEAKLTHFHVYGTLDDPIHAVNLQEKLNKIYQAHRSPFIISIDACLGKVKNIGHIKVGAGPIKPGAGVKKDLPAVGHCHLTGIVNVAGYMEFFVLQNTRLSLVMKMAKQMASGIILADQKYTKQQNRLNIQWDKKTIS